MAAPLVPAVAMSLNKLAIGTDMRILAVTTPLLQQCCGKKTKIIRKPKKVTYFKKGRGAYKFDGAFVYKGDVLARQLGLSFYPGENVGIQKNNTLFALRDGIVVVSYEKLNPYPDSPLYERVKNGMTIYKTFWNIYPTPVHAKFKLVSET